MKTYLDLMRHVLEHGARKDDRTGTVSAVAMRPGMEAL